MKKSYLFLSLIGLTSISSQGAVLINESFDGYANPGGRASTLTAPEMLGLTGNWVETNGSGDTYINRSGTALTDAFEFYKSSDQSRTVRRDTDAAYFTGITSNESFYASARFNTSDIINGDMSVILDNDSDGNSSDITFGFLNGAFHVEGQTAGSLAVDTNYRLIIKVTYDIAGTTDSVSLWVNPVNESSTPLISDYQASIVRGQFSTGGINGIGIFGAEFGGFTSAFVDDIRVGTTFDTVVPEPSTYALIAGFFALGGAIIRRRLRA